MEFLLCDADSPERKLTEKSEETLVRGFKLKEVEHEVEATITNYSAK